MGVEDYTQLLPILVFGAFFFVTAVGAFYWAAKRKHFRKFEEQAREVFTDEEPEGEVSDHFPGKDKTGKKP
ncbi:MAG: hypothetical protein ACLFUF_02780 [Opitutales bacterium]